MITIGMMHKVVDPGRSRKAYAIAAAAKNEGVKFIYFTPGNVDLATRTISGYIFERGSWIRATVPFPDAIYNAGCPQDNKSRQNAKRLRAIVPFTSFSVGNKITQYKKLERARLFSPYLIPTKAVTQSSDIFAFLEKYNSIVIKPVDSNKGRGITLIEKVGNAFYAVQNTKTLLKPGKLEEFVSSQIRSKKLLVQRFIDTPKTKDGNSFDFRIHVQKDGTGMWTLTSLYARIAPPGSFITNLSNGGATLETKYFLKREFGDKAFNIKQTLSYFGLALAAHMDDIYGKSFDELGIDVSLDSDHKIWLLEVNWRPGAPPSFFLEIDVAINTIRYAAYLARKKKR